MPRTIEPSIPKAGPLGMKVKRRKRRFRSGEQNSSSSQHLQQPPIASFGKPLEENFENSKSGVPCSANDGFDWEKENTSVVTDMPRNERTTTPQRIAKQTTAPKVLSANYSGKLKSKALVPNRTVEASRPVSAQRAARLGLALDTRSLMTSSSASPSSTSAEIVDHCKDFIRTLAARGAPPCIVATCSSLPNMNRSGTVSSCPIKPTSLKVSTFNIAKDAALLNLLTETNAAFSVVNINSDDVSSNGAMSIPCAMTAEQSWQLFGDMVESILKEDAVLPHKSKRSPMDIYIVCTDVSLFCDTNDTTHAIAASKLVDRVSPYFASSQIKSIQVIMAMSGLLELQHGASTQNREDTDIGSDVQVDNNGTNHRTSMSKCVRAIEYVFEKNEFAPNSMLDSAFGRGGNFVSVRFSVVSNSSIGFKSLSRQWIRNCLIELQPSCRINFDLPPTVDGTQCSVELDAAYQIFPFPIDSPQATMMTSDLQAISKLILSVIQLVPLATLDVSLFYGIPIKVGTALGIDCSQFQEMQVLVRTLFQSLQERESALVLRGIPHRTHGVVRSNKSAGIFQSTSEQLFVLLAQETPGSNSATSGVLHRIAHADHLVTEASVSADHAMDFSDSTMEAQYTEYIEASFSATAMRPFNPLDYASLYSLPPCDKTTVDTTEVKKSPEMQNPIVSPTETQSGSEGSGYLSISSRTEQETVNADESIGLGRDRMAANTVSLSPKKGMSSVWNDSAGIGACGPQSSMEAHCILENDDDDGDVSMFDADY